jgi:hypothetical protein
MIVSAKHNNKNQNDICSTAHNELTVLRRQCRLESPESRTEGLNLDSLFSEPSFNVARLITADDIVNELIKQREKLTQKYKLH